MEERRGIRCRLRRPRDECQVIPGAFKQSALFREENERKGKNVRKGIQDKVKEMVKWNKRLTLCLLILFLLIPCLLIPRLLILTPQVSSFCDTTITYIANALSVFFFSILTVTSIPPFPSYFCPSSSSFMLQFLHMCVKTFRFLSPETTIVSVEVLSFLQRTTRERREKSIYIHHQYFCPCVFLVSIKFLLLSLVVSFLSCFSCHSFLSSLDLFLFTLIPHVSFLEQEVEGVSVDHKKSVFEGIFRSDRIFLFLWRCQLRDTSSL